MRRIKRPFAFLFAGVLALGIAVLLDISGVLAENAQDTAVDTRIGEAGYIYLDLAAGNVNIGKTTYSGYVYVNGTAKEVKGEHFDSNKYYIYQSTTANQNATGYEKDDDYNNQNNCHIPVYTRVENKGKSWTDFVTNNTDVKAVSKAWDSAVKNSQRTATGNYITFAKESGYTADVTIDNIWSSYHEASTSRKTGGIGAHLDDQNNTSISLHLKGDNRVGCVHYSSDQGSGNHITFSNGDDDTTPGSITVADFPENFRANHWNAVIGAADNPANTGDMSEGIVINGGVIFAGSTPEDNCTAIGGGGNNYGSVTINGGKVTAVVSSTGTAIGGGIGYSNKGGNTDVIINDGIIYAYNLGIQSGVGDSFAKFVPAAAIGGGGSNGEAGGLKANITITGGTIYAQSMGGAAIGGGCSANSDGGPATITITGGTIIAKSTGGTFGTENITAGVSIGGGTGLTAGGSVKLDISGGILRTGSIGGGLATKEGAKVGSANVTISGGDIIGQVIMAGGNDNACTFKMTGGKIHNTNVIDGNTITDIVDPRSDVPIKYSRNYGGAVFMNDPKGVTTITGGEITNCKAIDGGAIWMAGGKAKVSDGKISKNVASNNGGAVYLPGGDFIMNGGSIEENQATNGGGIYLSKAPQLNGGYINNNIASQDGGGLYISDCVVELGPDKNMHIDGNEAKNGAGIYIHDSGNSSESSNSLDVSIDARTSASPGVTKKVGLKINESYAGHLYFMDNKASISGGAVCVNVGHFYQHSDSDHITVTGNTAENGGGVAVLEGNFTMTNGSIGTKDAANTATNGGGVYVSNGDIWFKGGSIIGNTATNGGGAYVVGNYNMIAGEISSNNADTSGGGIYVNDGIVTMYGGNVDNNIAKDHGGGIHVLSTGKNALVDILSGSISSNKSKFGGGISVVGEGEKTTDIDVTVGVNCAHNITTDSEENKSFVPFEYPDECGTAHKGHSNSNHINDGTQPKHSSCPVVKNNIASDEGGGFYLNSPQSVTTIYCLTAEGNKAENDKDSNCMKVNDGTLTIGDEDFDTHLSGRPTDSVKGNTIIHGSIMVEGGKVDVYGEMENPKFLDDVKVDVKEEEDHYLDHRIIKDDQHIDYKVHYYENFKGDGDVPTGLYIARQYPDEEHADCKDNGKYDFTVMASMFTHPGYKIVGWNAKPDDSGDKYEVNETYNLVELENAKKLGNGDTPPGDNHAPDTRLLVLYAIWERQGYVLKFDPNVKTGETYSGSMANQSVTIGLFDGTQKISKNQFKRPGYKFMGWTLNSSPTDTDKVYEDEHVIQEDFTDVDGATVTLYAKWEKCDHKAYLVYTANGNIMTESCSNCDDHTATAEISAVDVVYDGNKHLANVEFSTNWLGNKPAISYDMAESEWDDKDNIDESWTTGSEPLHAGNYTAKLTVSDATAKKEYTISPIKWDTPAVPEIIFKVVEIDGVDKSVIEISKPIGNDIMYLIKCIDLKDNKVITVEGYDDWQKQQQFSNIPFGYYYYFYAKRCADRDHIESDPSQSEAYLANGGNIVYIKNGTGIKVVPSTGDGYFTYTVSADNGYHLRDYRDNYLTAVRDAKPIPEKKEEARKDENSIILDKTKIDGTYTYTVKFEEGKVAFYQLTLEFSGAAKDASVASKVTDDQVFRDFNDKSTSISHDSAFTAQFTVSDYIPDEYSAQNLIFSEKIPAGTTIIMKSNDNYWYTKLDNEKANISLNEFIAMGADEKNKFELDTSTNTSTSFSYQFIVDFSQAKNKIKSGDLDVSLQLTANPEHSAPTIPKNDEKQITLGVEDKATFILNKENTTGKSSTLKCTYTPSNGVASIWKGRDTALVLTMSGNNGGDVPADLTLTAVVEDNTTTYTMSASNQFIIPLGKIGDKEIKITLNSDSFDSIEKQLNCTAQWYVSQSGADQSPLNGDSVAKESINFTCKKDSVPSVRIDGSVRLCRVQQNIEVKINYQNISSNVANPNIVNMTAYLQRKVNNVYEYTGASKGEFASSDASKDVTFAFGDMPKGSYRIYVVVSEDGSHILEVPYYFVIQ